MFCFLTTCPLSACRSSSMGQGVFFRLVPKRQRERKFGIHGYYWVRERVPGRLSSSCTLVLTPIIKGLLDIKAKQTRKFHQSCCHPLRVVGREPFIAAVMSLGIYAGPRKEEKTLTHHHAKVHYFERDMVTFTLVMSFLRVK